MLRIAVEGVGPAGIYAIGHLLENRDLAVEVDLYERLPTLWGLVRAGVAPDHSDKKSIIVRLLGFHIENPNIKFLANMGCPGQLIFLGILGECE